MSPDKLHEMYMDALKSAMSHASPSAITSDFIKEQKESNKELMALMYSMKEESTEFQMKMKMSLKSMHQKQDHTNGWINDHNETWKKFYTEEWGEFEKKELPTLQRLAKAENKFMGKVYLGMFSVAILAIVVLALKL